MSSSEKPETTGKPEPAPPSASTSDRQEQDSGPAENAPPQEEREVPRWKELEPDDPFNFQKGITVITRLPYLPLSELGIKAPPTGKREEGDSKRSEAPADPVEGDGSERS